MIEHFPIGKKLAFDATRGRLWVVCAQCRRWNLTPIEERWEAIEECERLYRASPLKTSTANIGLARARAGLELIRVGRSKGTEIAAWRYAGIVARRWAIRGAPLGVMTFGLGKLGSMIGAIGLPVAGGGIAIGLAGILLLGSRRRARVLLPDGRVRVLGAADVTNTSIVPTDAGWGLAIGTEPFPDADRHRGSVERWRADAAMLEGNDASRAMRSIVTFRNFAGAPRAEIDSAIALLDEVGDADRFLKRVARIRAREKGELPREISVAVEMALHDDLERRAMEGELARLEQEWAAAEEIAKIADDMFLPVEVRQRLEMMKT